MKRILLSKLRALGDTVLLSATLEECRRLFPNDEIHLLVPHVWRELYEDDARVDKLWTFQTELRGLKRLSAFVSLASKLRAFDFDISLACHANPTSSWLGFLSGAQKRAHHNHNFLEEDKFGNLDIPDKKILKPFIARDLAVLRALGCSVNEAMAPKIYLSGKQTEWAKSYFLEKQIQGPVLGLGLGASRGTKIWPIENFSKVARDWYQKTGGSVLCFVSASEKHLAQKWQSVLSGSAFKIVSDLALSELKSLLSQLDLFLGNDSGPRHLAASLGVRTLTIYGPQDPFECHPYNLDEHPYLFIEGLACRTETDLEGRHSWCGINECHVERHRCMVDISAEKVSEKLHTMKTPRK